MYSVNMLTLFPKLTNLFYSQDHEKLSKSARIYVVPFYGHSDMKMIIKNNLAITCDFVIGLS